MAYSKHINDHKIALLDTDANGNTVFMGSGGSLSWPSISSRKALLVGDSMLQFSLEQSNAVSAIVDNGDGTATMTIDPTHKHSVGSLIYVNVAPERKFNTFGSPVTAQTATTVTYTMASRTPAVTGTLASETKVFNLWRTQIVGAIPWAEFYLGDALNHEWAAAGGADISQSLTMLNEALVTGAYYDDIVICAGMNDIYARGNSFATIKADMTTLLNRAASTGARLHVFTVPPRDSAGVASWSEGKQTIHNQTNKWLWEYTRLIGGNPIDSWRATHNGVTWVNPAASNPDPTTGFTSASDYTHQLSLGANAMGKQLANSMALVSAGSYIGSHADVNGQGNILLNPGLTGTTGTATPGGGVINGAGGVPTSWTFLIDSGAPTATLTNPARTVAVDGDASGNNLQAIVVGAGRVSLKQSGLHTLVTGGVKYRIKMPVTITGASGMTGCEIFLFGANPSDVSTNIGSLLGVSTAMGGDHSGALIIDDWTPKAGMTSLELSARFTFSSGGATIVFGKPTFEPVIES